MITIFDTAKYILERFGSMHPMKLQMLCYYAQAWTLVMEDKPLFGDDFEVRADGPVCRALYEATKEKPETSTNDLFEGDTSRFTQKTKDAISNVIRPYVEKDLRILKELVQSEEPWSSVRHECESDETRSIFIPKESIQEYYSKALLGFI